jgi:hypothetical protein
LLKVREAVEHGRRQGGELVVVQNKDRKVREAAEHGHRQGGELVAVQTEFLKLREAVEHGRSQGGELVPVQMESLKVREAVEHGRRQGGELVVVQIEVLACAHVSEDAFPQTLNVLVDEVQGATLRGAGSRAVEHAARILGELAVSKAAGQAHGIYTLGTMGVAQHYAHAQGRERQRRRLDPPLVRRLGQPCVLHALRRRLHHYHLLPSSSSRKWQMCMIKSS